ncbi:zinc-binding metallopeptidase family protein [Rubinisphaera margarita]|uniref:zinc-binding metallopeptidase family protein n=1 Tax=Rubinisphaera margarita TaxID=2909586 RepID=UPI001EE7E590|nr:putative zinc-binding metallopeptidase [Rubinisphaera margarita]MCG6158017.1 putative zinc-binding peptidase [Rubinisphaera margarita]
MLEIFESITKRLMEAWKLGEPSGRKDVFTCRCERPVYFDNSLCLACEAPLGYEPYIQQVRALYPGPEPGIWMLEEEPEEAEYWKRCENFNSPAGCNWLVRADQEEPLCRSCRLNNTIPDLNDPDNCLGWRKIENAKRRLVAQLMNLGLPVVSKVSEDPERGVMFDFLRSKEGEPKVLTGHANGLITLNIEEANDSIREKIRHEMNEPYRTLLGHLRHEIGHYYWDRLIANTPWQEKFRDLFGDEREDYGEALKRNYENGPPADWATNHISSYASVHPWEDWAETWAHYLHVVDSLDTALRFGLRGEDVEQEIEPFTLDDLYDPEAPDAENMILLINSWVKLTTVLNELARSMGQPDFYPFVMSSSVLRKMHFIQIVVKDARGGSAVVE